MVPGTAAALGSEADMGNALSYRPGQIQDEPLGAVGGGLSDVFAPGGWDQRQYSQTPAQPARQKKSWGNALGSFVQNTLKAAAPEAYQQGVTDRMNSQISNALASGNLSGAAQAAYGANDWQTGMQLGEYGQQQEAAQRQQEAQGVLNLFQSAQPAQIAEMAMTDPVGFERMTGMTADEYTQAGQRMVQAGLSPEQFHQYVIQKAQAELGMQPAGPEEYTLAPGAVRYRGDERIAENPKIVDPQGPMSTIGKLRADLDAGRITEAQFNQAVAGIGKPGVSVTVGGQQQPNPYSVLPDGTPVDAPAGTKDLPAGQRYVVRGGKLTIENIPGGEQEAAAAEAERKRLGKDADTQQAGRTVAREVGRNLQLMPSIIGWGAETTPGDTETSGGIDSVAAANARIAMSKIAGTNEWKFVQNIESALSNVGLDKLQSMRDNSPTGGALGQVPIQQQQRLEQVLGSFKIGQDRPVIEENLKYLNNAYMDIMYGSESERAEAVQSGRMTPQQNAEIQANYFDLNWNEFGRWEPVLPPEKQQRLDELRAKRDAGALQ
jgi:hypothetical protein